MERVWALACLPGTNQVAIGLTFLFLVISPFLRFHVLCFLIPGYDDGVVMVKLGHEEPVVSMDSTGKIVLAKNSEILGAHVKMVGDSEVTDGERLVIATKEMGACEIYPQYMEHSPNGRFLVLFAVYFFNVHCSFER
jgi:coatomer subunit beta'